MLNNSLQYRLLKSASERLSVLFEKDHLKNVTANQDQASRVEVIFKGQLGYASSTHATLSELKTKAKAVSRYGDTVNFTYPKPQKFPEPKIFSTKVDKLIADNLVLTGERMVQDIKGVNQEILVTAWLCKSYSLTNFQTSSGYDFNERSSSLSVFAQGELVAENDILTIDNSFLWRDDNFDPSKFAQEITEKFTWSKNIVPLNSGSYQVIFTPQALTSLLEFLETALSGDSLYRKVSKWQESQGQLVTDKRFSLFDDPSIDFSPGSTGLDDEGLVCKPLPLLDMGVLKNYFVDLKSSERLKFAPNGRGFGIPAHPGLTNIVVPCGDSDYSKMRKNLKLGLIIDQLVGAGQDSPYSGDFSFNVHLGFKVQDGEIVGRVKDTMVSGNVFEMFKNKLLQISSETKWVDNYHLPWISFSETNITTKT